MNLNTQKTFFDLQNYIHKSYMRDIKLLHLCKILYITRAAGFYRHKNCGLYRYTICYLDKSNCSSATGSFALATLRSRSRSMTLRHGTCQFVPNYLTDTST